MATYKEQVRSFTHTCMSYMHILCVDAHLLDAVICLKREIFEQHTCGPAQTLHVLSFSTSASSSSFYPQYCRSHTNGEEKSQREKSLKPQKSIGHFNSWGMRPPADILKSWKTHSSRYYWKRNAVRKNSSVSRVSQRIDSVIHLKSATSALTF